MNKEIDSNSDLFVCLFDIKTYHKVMLIYVNYFADGSFRIKWWAIKIASSLVDTGS